MDEIKFKQNLETATKCLIDFTKTFCYNDFSGNVKYIITPNVRTVAKDDEHLNKKEISVLNTWNKYKDEVLTTDEVVNLLHHDNKVPVWIDMRVYSALPDLTIIDLLCSRRLREEGELMHPGLPPFHLQVAMPPDSLKVVVDGKFDVNWKSNLDEMRKSKSILTRLKQLLIKRGRSK